MYASQDLINEHEGILFGLTILEKMANEVEQLEEIEVRDIEEMVNFFKLFADKCHHGKEEGLMFPAMERVGVLWPMVSAYAMRLVPPNLHGRAIAVTMSGSTFGLGIGLPIMTAIGTSLGWRTVFGVLTVVIFAIAIVGQICLPSTEGEKRTKTNSPFYIARNKSVIICLILTFLTIMAHYGIYTYIAPLVNYLDFFGGIRLASLLFGIGTIISVVIAAKVVDTHLSSLIIFMLTLAFGSMLLFIVFKGTMYISHTTFLLWGVSFGALVTIFQAAVTRQVETGKDVATSLQSSTFNFGIVFGSALGGVILDNSSVFYIILMTMALLVVPILLSIQKRRIFS
jgi:predicted MFS family arabinose efflux permease